MDRFPGNTFLMGVSTQVNYSLPPTLACPYKEKRRQSYIQHLNTRNPKLQALLSVSCYHVSIPMCSILPSPYAEKRNATKSSAHLLQQIFGAQAEDLHVAVPVPHGKEGRSHSVLRHFPHFQAGNLNPSQLFRADFLCRAGGGGEGGERRGQVRL